MSSRPPEPPAPATPAATPLNPALKASHDTSHGTDFTTTTPMQSLSVQDPEEGSSWPMIWAIVALIGVGVTLYLLI